MKCKTCGALMVEQTGMWPSFFDCPNGCKEDES